MDRGSKQRPHKPSELGPRIFRPKGSRWWKVDLRPWDLGRRTMRNPQAAGWPDKGERTDSKEIANRWRWDYLDHVQAAHRRRVLSLPKDQTLRDAVATYLEHRRETVERATWGADRTALNHLLDAVDGTRRVRSVETSDVQRLVDRMSRQGYKATTLKTYVGSLGVFFRWAGFDTTDGVSLPNPGSTDVTTFDTGEVATLLDAARKVDLQTAGSPSAFLAVQIGLCMGLRQGEIFALRWQDVDESEKAVRVNYQIPKDSTERKPLKGKVARSALVLPEWWDAHRPNSIGLIAGRDGQPIGTRTQRRLITRVLDTAGLNTVGRGWHILRHTYARSFVERGGRLEELQRSLGHSNIMTTQDVYGHFRGDTAVRLAAERIYGG